MKHTAVPDPADALTHPAAQRVVSAAFTVISRYYVPERHQIAAVVLDTNGDLHTGLHLDAMVGRAAACAEIGALSQWRLNSTAMGDEIVIAAVRYPKPSEHPLARIVPPCGVCRELIFDHAPNAMVVIPNGALTPIAELIPHKYIGTKWANLPTPNGK